MHQISARASQIFENLFLEKLFRAKLSYFTDIDFSENVIFIDRPVPEKEIQRFLVEKAVDLD
jgi:hypothetical protein